MSSATLPCLPGRCRISRYIALYPAKLARRLQIYAVNLDIAVYSQILRYIPEFRAVSREIAAYPGTARHLQGRYAIVQGYSAMSRETT